MMHMRIQAKRSIAALGAKRAQQRSRGPIQRRRKQSAWLTKGKRTANHWVVPDSEAPAYPWRLHHSQERDTSGAAAQHDEVCLLSADSVSGCMCEALCDARLDCFVIGNKVLE